MGMLCTLVLSPVAKARHPRLDMQHIYANDRLLAEDGVIDCERLVVGLGDTAWEEDGLHLTGAGYEALGRKLGEAVVARFPRSSVSVPDVLHEGILKLSGSRSARFMYIYGCTNHFASRILVGKYVKQRKLNHGKPVYRKQGEPGSAKVVLFFWDERDGEHWTGWWLGPSMGFDHPGWARHEEKSAPLPPCTGWRVPPMGPVDVRLTISALRMDANQSDIVRPSIRRRLRKDDAYWEKKALGRRRIRKNDEYWQKKAFRKLGVKMETGKRIKRIKNWFSDKINDKISLAFRSCNSDKFA